MTNPLFPASGPATRSFNGLHPKSKFLAIQFNRKACDNWCGPCRVMDARGWPDRAVRTAQAGKFIIVKSDVDEEARRVLAQKYGSRRLPASFLWDSKGSGIARGGVMSSTEMVKFLDTSGAVPLEC